MGSEIILPRLSPYAIDMFEKLLPENGIGWEWGSGTSTIWLAQRSKTLHSIEHDYYWWQKVRNSLINNALTNVHNDLIASDGICRQNGYCFYKGHLDTPACFRSYVNAIDAYKDFDYIFVDGRARVGCLYLAMSKLKPGGLLILDNSEREKYGIALDALDVWPKQIAEGFVDGIFCKTTFWFKPNRSL